ncbi:hypothetical protein ACFYO8_12205 [Micromonospora sp. NPDC005257]|uniref:hypothetical protein n=1 Tax=unclassified Micromonospora TaxID=2617518 RepID=UPI0033B9510E
MSSLTTRQVRRSAAGSRSLIRLTLCDTSSVPAVQSDDPGVRERAERITRRHTDAIVEAVRELGDLGLVKDAVAEVRVHRAAPLFKLYILNGEEVFFGPRQSTRRNSAR